MFLCAGDGCTSCCMYKYIVVFFFNLLAASKVRVRGYYGNGVWDELFLNMARLHPASVLGGGGEAIARATLRSLERRQLQLPPRRAGFALQRQVLLKYFV